MERFENLDQNPESHDQQVVAQTPFWKRPWFLGLAGFSVIFLFLILSLLFFGWRVVQQLKTVKQAATQTFQSFEARDLAATKQNLQLVDADFQKAYDIFRQSKFLNYIPGLHLYWQDADHLFQAGQHGLIVANKTVKAIEPYADVLGFSGADTEQLAQSAEDKIVFIAETIKKIEPQINAISQELQLASQELDQINPRHYPNSLFGLAIRPQLLKAQTTLEKTDASLAQFQPMFHFLPELLGNPKPITYLLLFQNNAELRPTGGFITAYATLKIDKGKISAGVSQDIYTLDAEFVHKPPAPAPIKKYLPLVFKWNLRDMNLSPDFKVSMDTFSKYYREIPNHPQADAIIAIDTDILVRILKVLGPVGVPGYGGKFSADLVSKYQIPQVIYSLENMITRPVGEIRHGRKSILGPLMQSLLANMMNSPKSKWPEFFNIFTDSVREKHLLMYFFDQDKQKAVEALGAGGRIVSYDGDYLHLNDTNFAGAKSNLFVKPEIKQEITLNSDGSLKKKLILTYRNAAPPSNCNLEAGQLCLNGVLRDWLRIYVPKGSKLISFNGSEVKPETSEDLGKTVFSGFFTIAPESLKRLEVVYQTPPVVKGREYKLLIQKQAGKQTVKHTLILNGKTAKEIEVSGDTEVTIPLP